MPDFFAQFPANEQSWSTLGSIHSWRSQSNRIEIDCAGPQLRLTVLTPHLVRVQVSPTADWQPRRSWAVTLADTAWDPPPVHVLETAEALQIQTDLLTVEIQKDPVQLACWDAQERWFAQDALSGVGWRAGSVATWKQMTAEDHFYGLGERTGLLDKRHQIYTNWTMDAWKHDTLSDNLYQAIPFVMVLRPDLAYGIFLNSTFWSRFDLGSAQNGIWQIETRAPELDYFILYGPEPQQILQTYTQLTGRMPLPPLWSLGYHQCRWSYNSETKVSQLAHQFRQRQIPCDVIYLDIDYMRGYRVFTWDPKRFSDPALLVQNLAQSGFQVVTIVDPGVKFDPEAGYTVFDQGMEHDYFVRRSDGHLFHGYVWPSKSVFPDFLRSEVRQWWGDLHQDLTQLGIAGIWNDMNEPAVHDRPFGDGGSLIPFPLDAPQGAGSDLTTHAETHNLYGLMMARACREGLDRLRPTERSFVLTRSGFAGIQRWAAVWTGDNNSLWQHLEMSLPMLCNLSLSGVAFVGADIGGFAGNATPELFARWIQVGLLYPLMRGHSGMHTLPHEPWAFGSEVERICREFIQLRYRLLPYLYTLFWQAANTGSPILCPLLYHFPHDPHTYTLSDQVMLGPSLMAAPILRPGATHRSVYLPAGIWYDWWTGERYAGSTHLLATAPLDRMPLYGRAGSLIPLAPVMQHTRERSWDPLTLKIWPGNGEWTLYEDDGHSVAYQSGAGATTHYRVLQTGSTIRVEIEPRQGVWQPNLRRVIVEVVGMGEQEFIDEGRPRILEFEV